MPHDPELAPYLNMRIEPRVRYFTEIAARLLDVTLTEYIERALLESFKRVSTDPLAELDQAGPLDSSRPVAFPLWKRMDVLWDEQPILRLELLCAMGYADLMSDEQIIIWRYIFTQPDLLLGPGKLNRRLIVETWAEIKTRALAAKKAQVN